MPPYTDLIHPTLKAVAALGGSAQVSEIRDWMLDELALPERVVAITYDGQDRSVLIHRMDWARSYAKLIGALDSPKRGERLDGPGSATTVARKRTRPADSSIDASVRFWSHRSTSHLHQHV